MAVCPDPHSLNETNFHNLYKAGFASFQFHTIQLVANSALFNISALCSVFLYIQHLTMAYS